MTKGSGLNLSDSVVMGDVQQNITNTVENGRCTCPNCGTSGYITLYLCNPCRTQICDACRGHGYTCQNCVRKANRAAKKAHNEGEILASISDAKSSIILLIVTLSISVLSSYWWMNYHSNSMKQIDSEYTGVSFFVWCPCGMLLIVQFLLLLSYMITLQSSLNNYAKLEP